MNKLRNKLARLIATKEIRQRMDYPMLWNMHPNVSYTSGTNATTTYYIRPQKEGK